MAAWAHLAGVRCGQKCSLPQEAPREWTSVGEIPLEVARCGQKSGHPQEAPQSWEAASQSREAGEEFVQEEEHTLPHTWVD